MARIKKTSPFQNLSSFTTFIKDDNPMSSYFKISELNDLLTAGRNGFLIEGSSFLKPSTEIKIEVLDAEGNPIHVEPGNGIPEYYEGLSKLVSIHVYEDTPIGIGRITILGELEYYIDESGYKVQVPEEWRGAYNLKWERDIKINKNIPNETRVRFVKRPSIIIEEIDQSFYSRDVIVGTQTNGSVRGVAITPSEGTYLPSYRAGVKYLIENTTSDFVDGGSRITIPGTEIKDAEIIEYINQRSVVIQTAPTASGGYIQNLTGSSYSMTYQHNASPVASSILGSFGRFEINQLATFVGDVERVKVFRKSRSSNLDYQVIQDTRVESSELITAVISGSSEKIGFFSSSYIGGIGWDNYWNTSSLGTASLDSSKIYKGIKLRNTTLTTDLGNDIRLESGSEYTLEFYNYYETSSNNSSDHLDVYLTSTLQSGSGIANYVLTQSLAVLTGSNEYRSPNKLTYNFTPLKTDNWAVNFKSTNTTLSSSWHVGSVSLRASHELGFSPDEFTFTIPNSRALERETFDFKFEFFDINNNYIPIVTIASQTFQSGNINVIDKDISVNLDKQFFNFSSSLEGIPAEQNINIGLTKNRILGNLLITSQAYDTGGFEIPTASNSTNPYYLAGVPYPGVIENYSEDLYSANGDVTLAKFTGSLLHHPTQSNDVIVDRITYTLTETESARPFVKRFTLSRLVAGESGANGLDSKGLFVNANTNQFIYEPTGPALKPVGQTILITAKRSNLESLITPITANSSSGAPALTIVGTTDGVTTYSLNGSSYGYSLGEKTYAFTGSDSLGNPYSDFVKITPVMNFDGISVVLTNESSTIPAKSTGAIVSTSDLVLTSGSVTMRIASASIQHSNNNASANSFDIVEVTGSAGLTPNSVSPTTNDYGITAFAAGYDSGSLDLLIRYKAGDGVTTADFRKIVTYTKAKKAAPVLEFVVGNSNQSTNAYSTGTQITEFQTASMFVKEQYNGISTQYNLTTSPTINSSSAYTIGNVSVSTIALPKMSAGIDSVELSITGSATDSEGSARPVFGNISLTKVKRAAPSIILTATPQTQAVAATSESVQSGTLQSVALEALEGTGSVFNSASIIASNFTGGSISTKTLTLGIIPNGVPAASASIGINYTNSEGTTTSKTINVSAVKSIAGVTGASGSKGDAGNNGNNGSDGKRTATGMIYYQLSAASAPPTPSATSYTFSSNTFTGLTANWSFGAPTFAAGNSNKYWYSTYTAIETTAGGGTATPTFSSVTQAIGFTGLVTFTAANNITDGTNTSNIVEPGSVTNHIGGANVTTINGGKVSTGIITSTGYTLLGSDTLASGSYMGAGTIFNLDNGSLRSKNFFISSTGDAKFKGNLEAAGGTFTGTLSAANGSFSGTITANNGTIGGWTIGATSLTGGPVTLNNSGLIQVGAGDGRVLIDGTDFQTRYEDDSNDKTITIGPGGIIIKGEHQSGQSTPVSYISLQQYGNLARQIITCYGNLEPFSVVGFANGNNSAAINVYNGGLQVRNYAQSAYGYDYTGNGNGGYAIQSLGNFYCSGTGTFVGDVTANTSDKRLKKNIIKIDSALEKISNIRGVYFNWNEKAKELADKNTEKREIGFIAQEINEILPEIVKPAPFDVEMDESITDKVVYKSKTGEDYLTVQYEKIVPLLVEAIKELKAEIEELKRNR